MSLILYLLKTVLVSAILYGYYRIFLRDRPFHRYNRLFLLSLPLLAMVLPALQLGLPHFSGSAGNEVPLPLLFAGSKLEEAVTVYASRGFHLPFSPVSVLGVLSVMISLTMGAYLYRNWRYIRKLSLSPVDRETGGARIHFVCEPGTPFSFFSHIFWNSGLEIDSAAGRQMLNHELCHVRHHHSRDIILLEITRTICWFNPFFHLALQEMRASHEFQADAAAVAGADPLDYARLLLSTGRGTARPPAQSFFQNQIKRRIQMIISKQKKSRGLRAKIVLLPVLAVTAILFSFAHSPNPLTARFLKSDTIFLDNLKDISLQSIHTLTLDEDNNLVYIQLQDGSDVEIPVTEEMKKGFVDFRVAPGVPQTPGLKSIHVNNQHQISLKFFDGKQEMIMSANKFEQTDPAGQAFTKVEFEASYPGGITAWIDYLRKNLRYPETAVKNKIEGSVLVQFIVEKDGSLSHITAIQGPEELKPESIRVIEDGGHWIPAKQKGKIVRSYHRQPIVFKLERQ